MKRFLPLLLLALFSACAGPSKQLRVMYADSLRERLEYGHFSTLGDNYAHRQRARVEAVRELIKAGQLSTAEDYLIAGVLLTTSPVEDDLIAASASGLKAAELGEDRGLHVAAEALDLRLMHRGKPQKYGTQYYYLEVLKQWRLYPVDPATTDRERSFMGIAPFTELKAREAELNKDIR